VTLKLGSTLVAIKGDKQLRLKFGDRVGVRFDTQRLYWFDHVSGLRLDATNGS
jgi:hypothetical protein